MILQQKKISNEEIIKKEDVAEENIKKEKNINYYW